LRFTALARGASVRVKPCCKIKKMASDLGKAMEVTITFPKFAVFCGCEPVLSDGVDGFGLIFVTKNGMKITRSILKRAYNFPIIRESNI
jgi:hypothetical protein